jgi:hypothetical protein
MLILRRGLAVLFSLTIAAAAVAQDTTGALRGRVRDSQGLVLPGVRVSVAGPQGTRATFTDEEGSFVVLSLVPGAYDVRAERDGFKVAERRDITVVLGRTFTVGLTLEVGSVTETVQVSGTSPVVDTSSTSVGGILDADTLKHLPVDRNFTDTLYLVPGVSDSSGVGRANPSIAGGSGLDNNYVVDGVNITDSGFGGVGAFNAVHGSLGSGVTTDFIKETEVKTAGFEAEYGQSTGGVVNVVTKSGGNESSGGVFGYFRPSALEAEWKTLIAPNGAVTTVGRDEYDVGISVGGRVVPDRVFFYGTYNAQFLERSFIAPEGFPYRTLGAVDRKRRLHAYAGKLTTQLTATNRLDFSAFGDPSTGLSGLQRYTALRRKAYPGAPGLSDIEGGFSELKYGGHNQTVRYDGVVGSHVLVEGAVAHAANKFDEIPTVDDWFFQDLRFVPQGASGGLGAYERDRGGNTQLSAKSTLLWNGGGSHQTRYGVQFERIRFTRRIEYSGPGVTLADGRPTVTGVPVQITVGGGTTFYRAVRGLLVPEAETRQDYASLFVQDTWQIGRLTVRPGVRWERQHLEGVDPADDDRLPDLCFEGDSRPGAGDGTGAAVPCAVTWKNWAPRIGAAYDVFGTGRAKVYGAWGRFYAKIPNNLAARSMSADTGILRQDFRDPELTQAVANGTVFGGTAAHLVLTSDHATIIDPDAGPSYKNEFVAGVEFEVLRSANLGIRYVHRSMPQVLEDVGQLPLLGYVLAPGTPFDFFITNVSAATETVPCCGYSASFEDPRHSYDALELTLNKRFADNWSVIGSYRYSRLQGTFEGFYRSDNGQPDPAMSSLFDFPTNDPGYTEIGGPRFGVRGDIRYLGTTLGEGVLPNDRPHQVKVHASYVWRDVYFGLGVIAGSGRSLTALAANPVFGSAGDIPLTVRGEGFETSDGFRTRTPVDAEVNLHADYALRFNRDRQRLLLSVDVFNLLNRRAATYYDNWFETTPGTLNPNFGLPTLGGGAPTDSFQAPLSLRLGARFEW